MSCCLKRKLNKEKLYSKLCTLYTISEYFYNNFAVNLTAPWRIHIKLVCKNWKLGYYINLGYYIKVVPSQAACFSKRYVTIFWTGWQKRRIVHRAALYIFE